MDNLQSKAYYMWMNVMSAENMQKQEHFNMQYGTPDPSPVDEDWPWEHDVWVNEPVNHPLKVYGYNFFRIARYMEWEKIYVREYRGEYYIGYRGEGEAKIPGEVLRLNHELSPRDPTAELMKLCIAHYQYIDFKMV